MAQDADDAVRVMLALADELNRRRDLYAQHVGVDNLYAYNAVAQKPLPPVVCLIDEVIALMEDSRIENCLKTLATRGRKFGLWLILASQDWKAQTINTTIRGQLGTCVQFKARDAHQSRVLLGHPNAADIQVQGRAFAWIRGRDMLELQAPALEISPMRGDGPIRSMPETAEQAEQDDRTERILELAEQGLSDTAIARIVYGYANGYSIDRVRAVTTTTLSQTVDLG